MECCTEHEYPGQCEAKVLDLSVIQQQGHADEEPSKPNANAGVLIEYFSSLDQPLFGEPLRESEVWYLQCSPSNTHEFQRAILAIYLNGFSVTPVDKSENDAPVSVSWSPFTLVQACRFHTREADEEHAKTRLFRVSVFHHASAHIFGTQGDDADRDRARWVSVISRAHRSFTLSLFPQFSITTSPVVAAPWTATRILAGYLLQAELDGVSLVFCELHAHVDGGAAFAGYTDESCVSRIFFEVITIETAVSETLGIDNSCFTIGISGFVARSAQEKMLWLRAIQNVKVKILHKTKNPNQAQIKHYRSAICEFIEDMTPARGGNASEYGPLMPANHGKPPTAVDMYNISQELNSNARPKAAAKFHPSRGLERMTPPVRPHISEFDEPFEGDDSAAIVSDSQSLSVKEHAHEPGRVLQRECSAALSGDGDSHDKHLSV